MKKGLLFLMFSFCFLAVHALDEAVKVQMADGRTIYLLLSDEPVFVFNGEEVIIKAGSETYQCSIAELATTSFETKEISSIDQLPKDVVTVKRTSNGLILNHLEEFESVFLYSIDGQLISASEANEEGVAEVQISGSGIFILKLTNETIKIQL